MSRLRNLFNKGDTPIDMNIANSSDVGIDSDTYINTHLYSMYNQIFTGVINSLSGLSSKDKRLMFNNSSIKFNSKYGLIHYLVEGYVKSSEFILDIHEEHGERYIIKSSSSSNKKTNSTKVSFKHITEPLLARIYWLKLYSLETATHEVAGMSRTPIFKIENLRENFKTGEFEQVKRHMTMVSNQVKQGEPITMDAGDSVNFVDVQPSRVMELVSHAYSELANLTQLPLEFFGQESKTGLFKDNGGMFLKQMHIGLERYANEIVVPVINDLLGIECEYVGSDEYKSSRLDLHLKNLEVINKINAMPDSKEKKLILEKVKIWVRIKIKTMVMVPM